MYMVSFLKRKWIEMSFKKKTYFSIKIGGISKHFVKNE